MRYIIDKKSKVSAYRQLYEQLRSDITSGVYPGGTKLPSKRAIAQETGLSVITVEHAYSMLLDGGYVTSREKSGYFASADGIGRIHKPVSVETLTAPRGVADDFPFSSFSRIMRKVLSERGEEILSLPPANGCIELRAAISDYSARSRGISVPPERIVIGSGAEYLYTMIAMLTGKNARIAIEEPGYEKIRRVYEANGRECVGLSLGEDGILSSELERADASLLHVTPYHSYPSGVTASRAKRIEYVSWARERDACIVEDDYDAEFAGASERTETIFSLAGERTIYLNTFTKTIAPAMRVGYMFLPEKLSEDFFARLGFFSCTVPMYEQLVLAEFIASGDFERYIGRRRRAMKMQK